MTVLYRVSQVFDTLEEFALLPIDDESRFNCNGKCLLKFASASALVFPGITKLFIYVNMMFLRLRSRKTSSINQAEM